MLFFGIYPFNAKAHLAARSVASTALRTAPPASACGKEARPEEQRVQRVSPMNGWKPRMIRLKIQNLLFEFIASKQTELQILP